MSCNEYEGFRLSRTAHGAELEFVMPRELEGKLFARLYARGPLNDEALGDPARVWAALSAEYGGRPLAAQKGRLFAQAAQKLLHLARHGGGAKGQFRLGAGRVQHNFHFHLHRLLSLPL